MPIYDYLCTTCDHRADILHGINDPGPTFCPSCGAEGKMRKQFAAPAIHFKGSGWAKKDRGGSSMTKSAAKTGDGDGGSSSGGSSGSKGASGESSGGGSSGSSGSGDSGSSSSSSSSSGSGDGSSSSSGSSGSGSSGGSASSGD